MRLTAIYSTISAASIAALVDERYAIGPVVECQLFQRGANDTYALEGADGRSYMARLTHRRFQTAANVDYETGLLAHLRRSGIVVAAPVADREGQLWIVVEAPEGTREFIVFERLTGREPLAARNRAVPATQAALEIEALGASLAHLHVAGDSFAGPPSLYRIDGRHLLEDSLNQIGAVALPAHLEASHTVGETLRARLAARAGSLCVGHCHGDNHGGNNLITDAADGTTLVGWFDFEGSGPGFLAYDFATLLWQLVGRTGGFDLDDANRPLWTAFIAGYRRVRPILPADFEVIGLFVAIRSIYWLGHFASRIPKIGARMLSGHAFDYSLELARKWAEAATPEVG